MQQTKYLIEAPVHLLLCYVCSQTLTLADFMSAYTVHHQHSVSSQTTALRSAHQKQQWPSRQQRPLQTFLSGFSRSRGDAQWTWSGTYFKVLPRTVLSPENKKTQNVLNQEWARPRWHCMRIFNKTLSTDKVYPAKLYHLRQAHYYVVTYLQASLYSCRIFFCFPGFLWKSAADPAQ
jgi:hypothetical protein